ncbi:MAG TPA: hydrolase 2, exosortase A system-associated [Rhodocyclaceae bacterium]|nr:hydrolase 2, exosortase A system-associated [Rhodocyclaceae bacterium]
MAIEAFFLPAAGGQRFCLFHPPPVAGRERGAVVFVHPFAEEMNKSRRMAALQARRLAAAGYAVLQVDLLGCGDSSGNFDDADWNAWLEDVRLAVAWLGRRSAAPLWLWGLRTGCLVAAAAARELAGPVNFLFWQPTVSGKLYLQQFLRLKLAAALADGESRGMTRALRQLLAEGKAVEVAGYVLSPALAAGLEEADLAPPGRPGRTEWLELSAQAEASLAPASRKCLEAWRQAGHQVRERVVGGQHFWQTVETTECPALLDATLETLEEACP